MRRRIHLQLGTTAVVAALALALSLALSPAAGARAADGPRYDVPRGYTRCPSAQANNGFFGWASTRHATCRAATRFMRRYAAAAAGGPMPRRLRGYRCRIRYWRNADGDVYASRHTCRRGSVTIRFYGMA
jgi:hypothetical protein